MDKLIKELNNLLIMMKKINLEIEEIHSYLEKAIHDEAVDTNLFISEYTKHAEPSDMPDLVDNYLNGRVDLPEFLISTFGGQDNMPFNAIRLNPIKTKHRSTSVQIDIKLTAKIMQVVLDYKKNEMKEIKSRLKHILTNATSKIEA